MGPQDKSTEKSDDPEENDDTKEALDEAGYDTSDYGTGNKTFDRDWVADETDSSNKDASYAGHVARDDMADAGDMGVPADRHGEEEAAQEETDEAAESEESDTSEESGEADSDGSDSGDDGGDSGDGGDGGGDGGGE